MYKLKNGVEMPMGGFGVYQAIDDETEKAVLAVLKTGYRLLDTAEVATKTAWGVQ